MGMLCRNGCGATITFDSDVKSASGKAIPVDSITHEPHQCPNSDYALKRKGSVLGKSAVEVISEVRDEFHEFKRLVEDRLTKLELERWKQYDAKD